MPNVKTRMQLHPRFFYACVSVIHAEPAFQTILRRIQLVLQILCLTIQLAEFLEGQLTPGILSFQCVIICVDFPIQCIQCGGVLEKQFPIRIPIAGGLRCIRVVNGIGHALGKSGEVGGGAVGSVSRVGGVSGARCRAGSARSGAVCRGICGALGGGLLPGLICVLLCGIGTAACQQQGCQQGNRNPCSHVFFHEKNLTFRCHPHKGV